MKSAAIESGTALKESEVSRRGGVADFAELVKGTSHSSCSTDDSGRILSRRAEFV